MMDVEKSLDSQLWHACAGGMVQMPPVNSKVFYFPQGHAEHTLNNVDFGPLPRVVPALILCRVSTVKFLADPDTDEVYSKIRLVPIRNDERDYNDVDGVLESNGLCECHEKASSFAKTLTQSDANNGGGFSVPRYCAETIFPMLDYTADPPVQNVIAKDVHGEIWKFRHIYRGTPRRHLLTTGWSNFVNQKKLVAGDSIVFLRSGNGELSVGIRRAKRGISSSINSIGCIESSSSLWSSSARTNGGYSLLLREEKNKLMRSTSDENMNGKRRGKVTPESVIEAVSLAANGQSFEVVYHPRGSTPEFCIKAMSVSAAMKIQWCSGMRFKMAFETEDSSRISWFMGTVSSVQVADPIHWPNSPWRLLQVTWDEPDLVQNVKHVNPWLVELMSNIPVINLSPFSAPRKKLRLSQHSDFLTEEQFLMPLFSFNPLRPSSPFCGLSDNIPAGIQGARHAQYGLPLADLYVSNKPQLRMFLPSFQWQDQHAKSSDCVIQSHAPGNDNISCSLSIGNSCLKLEKTNNIKRHGFLLFGQPILTEQQITQGLSSDAIPAIANSKIPSDRNPEKAERSSPHRFTLPENKSTAVSQKYTGHCKVFLESEDIGQTLDLSVLGSFDELYRKLANMVGIESSEMLTDVFYQDVTGAVKRTGDEPFCDFIRRTKILTILMNTGSNNTGRKWKGLRSAEHALDSSNQTGPLRIFA